MLSVNACKLYYMHELLSNYVGYIYASTHCTNTSLFECKLSQVALAGSATLRLGASPGSKEKASSYLIRCHNEKDTHKRASEMDALQMKADSLQWEVNRLDTKNMRL